MATSKQRATYDDLKDLPEHVIGEIIDGDLIVSPHPAPMHARATTVLSADLGRPFDSALAESGGPGGWWFLYSPELHLHGDVLVPDVAAWRRERVPRVAGAAAIEVAPDWVCEVISRSTARYDRLSKMRIYAREKVAHAWLVDPANRTLEVLRLEGERMNAIAVYGGDEKVAAEPFAAVELELARRWVE